MDSGLLGQCAVNVGGMVQVAVPLQDAHTGISVPEKACVCVCERARGWASVGKAVWLQSSLLVHTCVCMLTHSV